MSASQPLENVQQGQASLDDPVLLPSRELCGASRQAMRGVMRPAASGRSSRSLAAVGGQLPFRLTVSGMPSVSQIRWCPAFKSTSPTARRLASCCPPSNTASHGPPRVGGQSSVRGKPRGPPRRPLTAPGAPPTSARPPARPPDLAVTMTPSPTPRPFPLPGTPSPIPGIAPRTHDRPGVPAGQKPGMFRP
jgi:hypothetical protein